MPWSVSWSVTHGERGARRVDDQNRVFQHEQVRFRLHLRDTNQRARDFVLDARNWAVLPQMRVIGLDASGEAIRAVEVSSARDGLLDFDYQFQWAGRKRIEFHGEVDLRRAEDDLHGGAGARASTMRSVEPDRAGRGDGAHIYSTYPPIALSVALEVIEEATEGEAHATAVADGARARARDRRIDADSTAARSERRAEARAAHADREARDARVEAVSAGLPTGMLRLPSPWTHLLSDSEVDALDEDTMREYSLDLQAAIRGTRAVRLDGNRFSDGAHTYAGHWTWAHSDGEIVFYFHADQISVEPGGGMRACDSGEAAAARAHSSMSFHPDAMIVGMLPGESRRVLMSAQAFGREASWTRLCSVIEAVDYVLTAFDVVELATGAGAIIAGVRRAASWLVRNTGRLGRHLLAGAVRHSDDLGRAAVRASAHAEDAVRSSRDLARGIGGSTTSASDDVARGLAREGRESIDEARGLASAVDEPVAESRGLAPEAPAAADDAARRADDVVDSDAAIDAMRAGTPGGVATPRVSAPEPYVATPQAWREFRRARREFARLQRGYARRLGLTARSGAQVHHAIELNVIARYGEDVFSVDELNSLANMRGIVPERTSSGVMSTRYGLRQLHNSAIRRRWDAMYEQINLMIANERLVPGTTAYRDRVRAALMDGRDAIDNNFSVFFSGSGAGLPSTFVDEATDRALRGGRSAVRWEPGMLARDRESLSRALPEGVALDPPPALRTP